MSNTFDKYTSDIDNIDMCHVFNKYRGVRYITNLWKKHTCSATYLVTDKTRKWQIAYLIKQK